MLKFVTRSMHAHLDYPIAIALIVLPFALDLGSSNVLAFSVSVAAGMTAILAILLTNYEFGFLRVLPYQLHLAADFFAGAMFLAIPVLFGFTGVDATYYLAIGATILSVVALHKPEEDSAATSAKHIAADMRKAC